MATALCFAPSCSARGHKLFVMDRLPLHTTRANNNSSTVSYDKNEKDSLESNQNTLQANRARNPSLCLLSQEPMTEVRQDDLLDLGLEQN